MMEQAEQKIIAAQLQEAARLIQAALDQSKAQAKAVQSNEDKLTVKNRIRRTIVMKFTCDIALKI